ncbi:COG4315 family predicted lipoprotein [Solicola gregarius]|uniref:Lipoprotein n=1 Tax=Solicola gregarius TaxID=2908642 RepID=A0AA46TJJ7_9ACTN|nr:hypothetical protein [Solicola gregarius]UYM06017.1 hypothetical protein L0C25_02800 [Solicola gregarius]
MRPILVSASAAVVALLVLSACGSDDESSSGGDDVGAGLTTATVGDVGSVLVDADGHPVYTNEVENRDTIKCVQTCVDFWPPVKANGDVPDSVDGVDGRFATIMRPDGGKQVTLDGQALYTFADDEGTDAVKGDGFEDDFHGSHFVWHVVTASGSASSGDSDDGGGYGGY